MDVLRDCPHCGTPVNASFDYCPKCNKGMFSSWDEGNDPKITHKKRMSRKVKAAWAAAAAVIVVAVIAANTPNPFRSRMEFNDVKLAEVFTPAQLDKASGQICSGFNRVLESANPKIYTTRVLKLDKANQLSARKALSFVNHNSWVTEIATSSAFESSLDKVSTGATASLISKFYPNLPTKWVEFQTGRLSPELRKLAMASCPKESQSVNQISTLLASYDNARIQIRDLAATVPWYPAGYNDYGDGNLAWKWSHSSCTLGDSCWHMKVVAASGCMSGLYAEINILDSSGSVIDYSNDLIPRLGSGQTALLEFSTYNSSARAGQLVEFKCY